MLISKAHAAMSEASSEIIDLTNAPTPMEAFVWNMGLVVVLVGLFYVLLIMPQQRRFKEHSNMLSDLKKGDRIVTGGGLVGRIDKVLDDQEVFIDLGNGIKVTALRTMIQGKTELKPKPALKDKDAKPDVKKDVKKSSSKAKTVSKSKDGDKKSKSTKTTKETKKA